jgi:hypothetical protein
MDPLSKILFLITATIFISSCTTLTSDIEVETHTDPDINYHAYHTYAWADSAQIVFDPVGQWEQPTLDTDGEVRFIINRELRGRNINQVDKDPDLLVVFAAGVDMNVLELKANPDADTEVLTNVPKTALVIALIDADTGYLVWLGYATADVQKQQTIENIRRRIDYAVSQIFKTF